MKNLSKIRVIVVEDEPIIAEDIELCLEEMGYEVLGIAPDAEEALELVAQETPDLVLMDIHIEGDIDGIELAHQLQKDYDFPIIFLTSYANRSTIERVKLVQPAAYIVKPFDEKDLMTNIELALYKHLQATKKAPPINQNPETYPASALFFVKVKHQLRKISPDEILWAEGADTYTFLHTLNGKFLISSILKKVEEKLKPHRFLRVHKSYVIALDRIEALEEQCLYIQEEAIPIGKAYKKELMQYISTL